MDFFNNIVVKERTHQRQGLREKFRNFVLELKVRGYSEKTIDSYLFYNGKFLNFIKKDQRSITSRDIKAYLNSLILKNAEPRTVNMAINSLRAYYEGYLKKKLFKDVKRAKNPKNLPPIISKEEVLAMIRNTMFLKHRLLVELLYSSGLRVGECVRLKIDDIDLEHKLIFVRQGKGRKDRFSIVSNIFIEDLRSYLSGRESSSQYLFSNGVGHISIRSAEVIVEEAAKKAGIKRKVFPHLLRACFATYLLENGTSIEKVQRLLGHSRIQTTLGYIRLKTNDLRQIKSPLD